MKFIEKWYSLGELREKFSPIFAEYGLFKVYVFGSYARGEEDPKADIDLLIKTDGIMELTRFYEFVRDLHRAVRVKVDITFEEYINPSLKEDIKAEAILLYQRAGEILGQAQNNHKSGNGLPRLDEISPRNDGEVRDEE